MTLELGPGDNPQKQYDIHLDCRAMDGVEVVGLAEELPFRDGCFETIFNQHLLEHYPRSKTVSVLREWRRVLTPGGELRVLTPNLLWLALAYIQHPNAHCEIVRWLFGGQEEDWNFHKTAFDFDIMSDAMKEAGFKDVELWDHPINDFGLWVHAFNRRLITLG